MPSAAPGWVGLFPRAAKLLKSNARRSLHVSLFGSGVFEDVCVPGGFRRVRLFVTPWAVAPQAPPSVGFSRQECWSGLPFPTRGDLPEPPALAGGSFTTGEAPGESPEQP